MAYKFGGHRPSMKGRHPGSSTGPEMRGSHGDSYHYLEAKAPVESASSPKAVDRTEGRPSSGEPTPNPGLLRGYQGGGEVNPLLANPPTGQGLGANPFGLLRPDPDVFRNQIEARKAQARGAMQARAMQALGQAPSDQTTLGGWSQRSQALQHRAQMMAQENQRRAQMMASRLGGQQAPLGVLPQVTPQFLDQMNQQTGFMPGATPDQLMQKFQQTVGASEPAMPTLPQFRRGGTVRRRK